MSKTIRLKDRGPQAWSKGELVCSQSNPYLSVAEDHAELLVNTGPFEWADEADAQDDPTISERVETVLSGTLDDLDDALESGEFDNHLDRLESYEEDHKDREGAYQRIDAHREG